MSKELLGVSGAVELADGPVPVSFDMNTLILIEDQFGGFAAVSEALDARPFGTTRYLLWAAMGAGDEVTLAEVGQRMTGADLRGIVSTLSDLMARAIGTTEGPADPTKANGAAKKTPATRSQS